MEVQRSELVTLTGVELVLELDPVETKSVQVALQRIHDQQHTERRQREEDEHEVDHNGITAVQRGLQDLAPEHFGQLYTSPPPHTPTRVSQTQSPQTEVRRRVRDATQAVLNGLRITPRARAHLDTLEDEQLAEGGGLLLLVRERGVLHQLRLHLLVRVLLEVNGEDDGLEQQHPRHRAHHGDQQVELHLALRGEQVVLHHAGLQREVDQRVDQGWRVVVNGHARVPVLHVTPARRAHDEPLDDDEDDHPAEEGEHEDHLGNIADIFQPFPVVAGLLHVHAVRIDMSCTGL